MACNWSGDEVDYMPNWLTFEVVYYFFVVVCWRCFALMNVSRKGFSWEECGGFCMGVSDAVGVSLFSWLPIATSEVV